MAKLQRGPSAGGRILGEIPSTRFLPRAGSVRSRSKPSANVPATTGSERLRREGVQGDRKKQGARMQRIDSTRKLWN